MSTPWAPPPKIVALTGAALSREAGFAPFAADRMPAGLRLEDVVTQEGFARDPVRVQDFYNLRRRELLAAVPSAVHEGLAVLDIVRPRELLIVTGNIDDLHERAGSRAVIHLQGELLRARCAICGKVSERHDDITPASDCPICGNAGHLRPHIVWVGEEPLRITNVYQALAHASLFLAIGVVPGNEPAQSFLAEARRAGARTVELNRDLAPDAEPFDERITGPLTETVPAYVKKLIAEG
jgi:NAD-dependent protein deacetylase/lipoamidase